MPLKGIFQWFHNFLPISHAASLSCFLSLAEKRLTLYCCFYNTKNEWVTKKSDSRVCFGVWKPDDCVIRKNICQVHVSSPFQFPLHSYTPQLVCVREGSHTLHLLHPEAAPLMGVPSIVVLLLVHNLQEWLESFLSGVEKLRDQTGKISLFCLKRKLDLVLCFAPFSFCLSHFAFSPICPVQIVGLSGEANPPCVNTS